jgi:hypothetical protein
MNIMFGYILDTWAVLRGGFETIVALDTAAVGEGAKSRSFLCREAERQ